MCIHSPVLFILQGEMSWRSGEVHDIMGWLDGYIMRRYGGKSLESHIAWQMLLDAAYRFQWTWSIRSIASHGPSFTLSSDTSFNPGKIADAWRLLVIAVNTKNLDASVGPLRYDIVDIGRQVLVNLFHDVYKLYTGTFLLYNKTGDVSLVTNINLLGSTMLDILKDLDTLLATDVNFLLGNWLLDAKESAPDNASQDVLKLIEFNARNQITMWGPHENIEDYAGKEWAGVVGTYYMGRWQLFVKSISDSIMEKKRFNLTEFGEKRFQFEQSWDYETTTFPTKPVGDTIEVANSILKKYFRDEDSFKDSYIVMVDEDIKGNDLYGQSVALWTNSTEQIMWFCDINPMCAGFSLPDLSFKSSVGDATFAPGSMVFVKNKKKM